MSDNHKKNSYAYYFRQTLAGRITMLTLVIITFNIFFLLFTAYQNQAIFKDISDTKDLNLKNVLLLNDLLITYNKTATLLSHYINTYETHYNEERLEVWNTEINPLMQELNELKSTTIESKFIAQIDTFLTQLKQIKSYQTEIENRRIPERRNEFAKKQINDILQKKLTPIGNQFQYIITKKINTAKHLLKQQLQDVNQNIARNTSLLFLEIVLLIASAIAFIYLIKRYLHNLINKVNQSLDYLNQGNISYNLLREKYQEVNEVIEKINQLTESLQQVSFFAQEIGKGNLDAQYQPKGENDVLGNTLIEMRNRLKTVAQEDEQRAWVAEGLAKFADLFRNTNQDLRTISRQLVEDLAHYVQVPQIGAFILQENDKQVSSSIQYLELIACYAYSRQKYLQKVIKIHATHAEGLIGQAFLERSTIYLKDVAQKYSQITSGLGEANPTYFLIVPIKRDWDVEGALELASFTPFEPYKIEFLEKLAENFYFFIKADKVNRQTQRLLQNTQTQAELLRTQEEEMRQNMEEMQATQEEMAKKSRELEYLLKTSQEKEEYMAKLQQESEKLQDILEKQIYEQTLTIGKLREKEKIMTYLVDYSPQLMVLIDKKMQVQFFNANFEHYAKRFFLEAQKQQSILHYISKEHQNTWKDNLQQALTQNQKIVFEQKIFFTNDYADYCFILQPIKSTRNTIEYIAIYAQDITQQKQKQLQIENQQKQMQIASEMAKMGSWQIDIQKKITTLSNNAAIILEIAETEFTNEINFFSKMVHPEDKAEFNRKTEEALQLGNPFEIDVRMILSAEKQKWIKIAGRATKDEFKRPVQVNGFIQDITLYKFQEQELRKLKKLQQKNIY